MGREVQMSRAFTFFYSLPFAETRSQTYTSLRARLRRPEGSSHSPSVFPSHFSYTGGGGWYVLVEGHFGSVQQRKRKGGFFQPETSIGAKRYTIINLSAMHIV